MMVGVAPAPGRVMRIATIRSQPLLVPRALLVQAPGAILARAEGDVIFADGFVVHAQAPRSARRRRAGAARPSPAMLVRAMQRPIGGVVEPAEQVRSGPDASFRRPERGGLERASGAAVDRSIRPGPAAQSPGRDDRHRSIHRTGSCTGGGVP